MSKRMLLAAAAAVVVLLAALVALVFSIPVDDYRPLLISTIEDATGRVVQIDALKLRLLPSVRVRLVNFRLRNPAGFPAGDALVAQSIDLGINARALLSRRLDVTFIAPSGVHVDLLRNAKGDTNFAFAPRAESHASPLLTVEQIPSIAVKGGTFSYADVPLGSGPGFSLDGVNATIASIDPHASNWVQKLSLAIDLRGATMTSSVLAKPLELHAGAFDFKGNGGRGSFAGTLGTLALGGDIAFPRLDPLAITFALESPEVDLNDLSGLMRSPSQKISTHSRRLLAAGTLRVQRLTFATMQGTNATAQVSLYTTALDLRSWALSAYGGSAQGTALIDTVQPGVPTQATVRARGLDVAQLAGALAPGGGGLGGTLDADMSGSTLLARDPQSSLSAEGTFSVRNGTLPSAQLHQFSYLGGDLRISGGRGYSNDLRFLSSGIRATLHGSFGFNETLSYAGTAIVNAPSEIPEANVRALVSQLLEQHVGTTQAAVPFSLQGSFADPQFRMTGTPQLVGGSSQSSNSPVMQDLQKLLQGVPKL